MNRLAATTAGVLILALLSVGAASGKPPGPTIDVACSQQALVDAINTANTAGGGTLKLAQGCHYQLTMSPDDSENGLPPITTQITINGNQATIDGTDSFRVLEVDGPDGNLVVSDLTITHGLAQDFGGGIANFGGTVLVDHTQVIDNTAVAAGGGIANATFDPSSVATLTLHDSFVRHNLQSSDDPDTALGGGGIVNVDGTVTVNFTHVNANTAEGFVGGGIASGDYLEEGGQTVLKVNNSQVDNNSAPNAGGGGIENALGSVAVNMSKVNGNTALNGGGIASGNQGNPDGTAELTMTDSTVNGNTATAGPPPPGEGPPIAAGGIANGGDAVLTRTQVDGNTATLTTGGGIVNHAQMILRDSEVHGNKAAGSGAAASGGGILNVQGPPDTGGTGTLTLNDTKVTNNSAGGNGGGIANGVGGMLVGGDVTLKHSAVNDNNAAHGGGIFNNGGTVKLMASTVTGNHVDNCEPTNTIPGCTN
jgi:hypothetical protein